MVTKEDIIHTLSDNRELLVTLSDYTVNSKTVNDDWAEDVGWSIGEDEFAELKKTFNGWRFTSLATEGGYEGGGDAFWLVFKVEVPDYGELTLRVDGWYASYDGGYLDGDIYEVEPYQVTVTRYRTIKKEK